MCATSYSYPQAALEFLQSENKFDEVSVLALIFWREYYYLDLKKSF